MIGAASPWSRPRVWERGEMPDGQPTAGIISPSHITVDCTDFDAPPSLTERTVEWRTKARRAAALDEFFAMGV